jgi:hypothetical protein
MHYQTNNATGSYGESHGHRATHCLVLNQASGKKFIALSTYTDRMRPRQRIVVQQRPQGVGLRRVRTSEIPLLVAEGVVRLAAPRLRTMAIRTCIRYSDSECHARQQALQGRQPSRLHLPAQRARRQGLQPPTTSPSPPDSCIRDFGVLVRRGMPRSPPTAQGQACWGRPARACPVSQDSPLSTRPRRAPEPVAVRPPPVSTGGPSGHRSRGLAPSDRAARGPATCAACGTGSEPRPLDRSSPPTTSVHNSQTKWLPSPSVNAKSVRESVRSRRAALQLHARSVSRSPELQPTDINYTCAPVRPSPSGPTHRIRQTENPQSVCRHQYRCERPPDLSDRG